MKLSIESSPELLTEYGRAFAWINYAEIWLNIFLLLKGKLNKANGEIVRQMLDEMMIGKKIKLASSILPDGLESRLWKLNDKRLLLAHGVTGEKPPVDSPQFKTGKYYIEYKQNQYSLDLPFFKETVDFAKKLGNDLRKEALST